MLTADQLRLGAEIDSVIEAGVEFVHIDVMDGVFCPTLTVGPGIVQALPSSVIKDVHLMIDDPLDKVDAYVKAGADIITFHAEATGNPRAVLQRLAGTGVVRGVALKPRTPLEALQHLLDDVELVLLLAVNPGQGGQVFNPGTGRRMRRVRELIDGREVAVAVDGGVTKANVDDVVALGADLIVAGSAIFDGVDAPSNAKLMLEALRRGHSRLAETTRGDDAY